MPQALGQPAAAEGGERVARRLQLIVVTALLHRLGVLALALMPFFLAGFRPEAVVVAAMGDGSFDVGKLLRAVKERSREQILFDMDQAAEESGGVINAVTRSGGNEFHGQVGLYFDNDALRARPRETLRLEPGNEWARQGLVTALKARNPIYGLFLQYALFMGRLSPRCSAMWILSLRMPARTTFRSSTRPPTWIMPPGQAPRRTSLI